VKKAVATEASQATKVDPAIYYRFMISHGLLASVTVSKQFTLNGAMVYSRAVTGYKPGNYKIMVQFEPTQRTRIAIELSEDAKETVAHLLLSLGFDVEREEQRIRAVKRGIISLHALSRIIRLVERKG